MSTSEITDRGAASIAADVNGGRVPAREVVDAFLDRLHGLDGSVRATLHVMDDAARARADGGVSGPLAGVPVIVKDNMCTRGVPTTCGSRILEGWRPPYNATVIDRLAAAGAIVIAKANMDEFAMGSSTENSAFFPTHNPWDLTRVPGGSSGGSAAAVAARFAPVSLGSDTGGSIRQPAALCGVVGVKPTYGRVSRYGLVAFASSLDQIGPFARSTRDAALLLEAVWGHDAMDSTSIPSTPESILASLGDGVKGLRVGVVRELTEVDGIQSEVAAAVDEAARILSKAGATVQSVSVPSVAYGLSAYYLIAPAEASSNLSRYDGMRYGLRVTPTEASSVGLAGDAASMQASTRHDGFGAEVKRRIMLGTYALSAGYYDAFYGQAQRVRTLIIRDFARAYEEVDVLLSPTAPTTAFGLGAKVDDPLAMYLSDVCTIPTNLAGACAMSLPAGLDESGLPIGVQVLAPALGEALMFRVAQVLEDGFAFEARPSLIDPSQKGAL